MTKLTKLYGRKARQDFRIYKMKKMAPDLPAAVEFLNQDMTEIETDIEAIIRKSKNQVTLRVIAPTKQREIYKQEATRMIRDAYEQIHIKCSNCHLYQNYNNNGAAELDLCARLEIEQRIEKGFVKRRDLQAVKMMPPDEFCNKYEPIGPEELALPNIEESVAEIKEWLQDALIRLN
ncbi:hypothetical protein KY333_00780 [Candidatus Woesearchaeota archaeon]|nr:hypothetical protein [Candidatus Woesearchaeota archaeon]MBW2993949.1 hypothetical protein [Candidatus Woesearchaeota archaeon]